MVPVLIEPEEGMAAVATSKALKNVIRRHLQTVSDARDRIPESFCEELLRTRRILLILDGLSEIPGDLSNSKENTGTYDPEFIFNALI
jgi:hypothetical protein